MKVALIVVGVAVGLPLLFLLSLIVGVQLAYMGL